MSLRKGAFLGSFLSGLEYVARNCGRCGSMAQWVLVGGSALRRRDEGVTLLLHLQEQTNWGRR